MKPNLPGLACHMIKDNITRHIHLLSGKAQSVCGRLVPNRQSRVTQDLEKVSCRLCLRRLAKKPSAVTKVDP